MEQSKKEKAWETHIQARTYANYREKNREIDGNAKLVCIYRQKITKVNNKKNAEIKDCKTEKYLQITLSSFWIRHLLLVMVPTLEYISVPSVTPFFFFFFEFEELPSKECDIMFIFLSQGWDKLVVAKANI